jgi:GntR family transcriptional repressor for pyruvate dehydrogenase complex
MEFEPITTKRTVDIVVERLEERILNGTYSTGDMLPSEAQLAGQLGVGRRSIREALKVLEMKGLLIIRKGVGSIVNRNDLGNFLSLLTINVRNYLRLNMAEARHVADLRHLLEGAALVRLAASPDDDKIKLLTEAVLQQRKAAATQDFHAYQDWHVQFHHEIIQVLDNPIISMIHEQTLALMRTPMEEVGRRPGITSQTIEEHAQIVEAVKNGAVEDVDRLLTRHLDHFLTNLDELNATHKDTP